MIFELNAIEQGNVIESTVQQHEARGTRAVLLQVQVQALALTAETAMVSNAKPHQQQLQQQEEELVLVLMTVPVRVVHCESMRTISSMRRRATHPVRITAPLRLFAFPLLLLCVALAHSLPSHLLACAVLVLCCAGGVWLGGIELGDVTAGLISLSSPTPTLYFAQGDIENLQLKVRAPYSFSPTRLLLCSD